MGSAISACFSSAVGFETMYYAPTIHFRISSAIRYRTLHMEGTAGVNPLQHDLNIAKSN